MEGSRNKTGTIFKSKDGCLVKGMKWNVSKSNEEGKVPQIIKERIQE